MKKKKVLVTGAIAVLSLLVLASCGKDAADVSDADLIGELSARDIALKDAGYEATEVSELSVIHEIDDNNHEYEVDFKADNKEYEYTIDGVSGKILDKADEISDDVTAINSNVKIAEEEAKKIAIAKADGATVENITIYLSTDDNKQKYEGTITYNGTEYEFEIDANTGEVLEWDAEND